jgi:hypothetical protein
MVSQQLKESRMKTFGFSPLILGISAILATPAVPMNQVTVTPNEITPGSQVSDKIESNLETLLQSLESSMSGSFTIGGSSSGSHT